MTYEVPLDDPGTHYWHAHAGSLRAEGPAGALIVDDPGDVHSDLYDEELPPLMLSDWWRDDSREQAAGLSQKNFRWIGDPASVLHNGVGLPNGCCETGGPPQLSPPCECTAESLLSLHVEFGRRYRLRLINAGALSYLNFQIEGTPNTLPCP